MRVTPQFPPGAKAVFVGEASGKDEDREGLPFVGVTGREFDRLLLQSGLVRSELGITNVFLDRPPNNKLDQHWCSSKKVVSEDYVLVRSDLEKLWPDYDWPKTYTWSKISQGKYLQPGFLGELARLQQEIRRAKPNIIVALGGKALWALAGTSAIKKNRGAVMDCVLVPGIKLLPTWHPAYIQRAWEERSTLVADLMKAKDQKEFPDIRRPERHIWVRPSLADMEEFFQKHILGCDLLAFDTETRGGQITCISFAPHESIALVIPFVERNPSPDYNYWKDPKDEVLAWQFVQKVLDTDIPKLAQNGLYDLQYLWTPHGISIRNFASDTMLLHHSIYIELPKGLGFLGSIHTEEVAWKLMRTRSKDSVEKKDE